MTTPSIFDHFKKTRTTNFKPSKAEAIYFQLDFDDFGAFLLVVDAKQHPIEVDSINTVGATRHMIRSLEKIQNTNNFVIDWQKPNDRVYLGDHEYLIWQLRHCDNVIDANRQPIQFREGAVTLKLVIKVKNAENRIVIKKTALLVVFH